MSVEWAAVTVPIALALVAGLVWLIRLEGRINVSDARIAAALERSNDLTDRLITMAERWIEGATRK